MILLPEGCAYRRCAIAALKASKSAHSTSALLAQALNAFGRLLSAAWGNPVLARVPVAPPPRIVSLSAMLPDLPAIDLVYTQGRRSNSRVLGELATYLADNLANTPVTGNGSVKSLANLESWCQIGLTLGWATREAGRADDMAHSIFKQNRDVLAVRKWPI